MSDFVVEALTSGFTGTGARSLGGAISNNRRFREVRTDGATVYAYLKTLQGNTTRKWEFGEYELAVSGGGDTLTPVRIDGSSNTDSAIDWQTSDTTIGTNTGVWIYMAPPLGILAAFFSRFEAVGAADGALTANDSGVVFKHNVSAGNHAFAMVAGSTLDRFFRFGIIADAHASNHVAVTPAGADKINGSAAAWNVVGNTGITWFRRDPDDATQFFTE